MTYKRFDPNARITQEMMWRPKERATTSIPRNPGAHFAPTWSSIFKQILVALIEILIPMAFIVGMLYWRAPWLFWAVVHFFRGEPIIHF